MMEKKYLFSKYSHSYINHDTVALFHSLRMKPVFVSSTIYNLIKKIDSHNDIDGLLETIPDVKKKESVSNVLNKLIDNKILITDKRFDERVIDHFRASIGEPSIEIAYFILSERCNFDCKYCFIKRGNKNSIKSSDMTVKIAKDGLRFFAELVDKSSSVFKTKKTIVLYGGEPLLNFDVINELVKEIKIYQNNSKLPENLDISIISNGSMITQEVAKFFKTNNISVGISIDGDDFATNSNRIFQNSQPTYESIKKGIEICKNENVKLSLSVTLTEESLSNTEKTIKAILDEETIKTVGFNMLLTDKEYTVSDNYNQRVSEFIINAFSVFRKNNIYEDRMMRKVNSFFNSEVYLFDCGAAGGNQIVIAPDGKVGICHGFLNNRLFFDTNIYDESFDPTKSPVYCEWNKRTPINMEKCQNCPALGICGGGCPMNAYNHSGSIWALDERFCTHAKITLEWLIWDLFSKINKN